MTDQQTPLKIIGAASGLGAPDARCGAGPTALLEALQQHPVASLAWDRTITPATAGGPQALPDFMERLADRCSELLQQQQRIAVVGGDHACAMGSWRGIRRAIGAPVGLIWIDAHLDAHTPATSPRGYWHGMPVAALLGRMNKELGHNDAAAIEARHLCIVGARSYEGAEWQLLHELGVRVITMEELNRIGFTAAMAEALRIATDGTEAFGISLDLDALDPQDAPAVGSPVVGGIHAAELLVWLAETTRDPRLRALELTEFNPTIDLQHQTLQLIIQILKTASGVEHEPDH